MQFRNRPATVSPTRILQKVTDASWEGVELGRVRRPAFISFNNALEEWSFEQDMQAEVAPMLGHSYVTLKHVEVYPLLKHFDEVDCCI